MTSELTKSLANKQSNKEKQNMKNEQQCEVEGGFEEKLKQILFNLQKTSYVTVNDLLGLKNNVLPLFVDSSFASGPNLTTTSTATW